MQSVLLYQFVAFFLQPQQPQRGHRVRPQDVDDLPISWARQAKLSQLNGTVPTAHQHLQVATFAAGCYWGPELAYQRQPGVIATCVGHTGYETGGANEAVQLLYDPAETTYEALLDVLWAYIDPTLKDQVGNDRGVAYRHAIYTHSDAQHAIAMRSLAAQQRQAAAAGATVWTRVEAAQLFYVASPRHQRYLARGMKGEPQCAHKGCSDPIRCYGGVAGRTVSVCRSRARARHIDRSSASRPTVLVGRLLPLGGLLIAPFGLGLALRRRRRHLLRLERHASAGRTHPVHERRDRCRIPTSDRGRSSPTAQPVSKPLRFGVIARAFRVLDRALRLAHDALGALALARIRLAGRALFGGAVLATLRVDCLALAQVVKHALMDAARL